MEKQRAGNYRRAASSAVIEPEVTYNSASDLAAQRLWVARFLAELLDQRFAIPGTSIRIGLDPILGLVPAVGDLLANLIGSAILFIAAQFNIPKVVLLRMGLNIAVNALIGAIPIFGDIFSIWFRSNVMNVQLLERYAADPRRGSTAGDWLFVIALVAGLLIIIFGILAGVVWLISRLANLF
jgi:hypothetical protein